MPKLRISTGDLGKWWFSLSPIPRLLLPAGCALISITRHGTTGEYNYTPLVGCIEGYLHLTWSGGLQLEPRHYRFMYAGG